MPDSPLHDLAADVARLHARASGSHPFDKGQRRACVRMLDAINQQLDKAGRSRVTLSQGD